MLATTSAVALVAGPLAVVTVVARIEASGVEMASTVARGTLLAS